MRKSGFDRFLTVFLSILVVGIIGLSVFLVYKYYQKYNINKDANEFIEDTFDEELAKRKQKIDDTHDQEDEDEASKEQNAGGIRGIDTDALTYKNYVVAGKIEMPTVNLQYPVLDYLTDMDQIEVSVAMLYGVGLNNVGNTVIIGHNYRNGLFFGSNKNLKLGDTIYITDWETGNRRPYTIYNKYTTEEADSTYMQRDTEGRREVTLVTCQGDNRYRLVIYAKEQE